MRTWKRKKGEKMSIWFYFSCFKVHGSYDIFLTTYVRFYIQVNRCSRRDVWRTREYKWSNNTTKIWPPECVTWLILDLHAQWIARMGLPTRCSAHSIVPVLSRKKPRVLGHPTTHAVPYTIVALGRSIIPQKWHPGGFALCSLLMS